MDISPNDKLIVSASQDKTAKVRWSHVTCYLVSEASRGSSHGLCMHVHTHMLLQLWQVTDGSLMGTFRGHRRGVWSAKFSPVDQVRNNFGDVVRFCDVLLSVVRSDCVR